MFKNSAPTSQRTKTTTFVNICHLLMLMKIMPYCCGSYKKHINQETADSFMLQ